MDKQAILFQLSEALLASGLADDRYEFTMMTMEDFLAAQAGDTPARPLVDLADLPDGVENQIAKRMVQDAYEDGVIGQQSYIDLMQYNWLGDGE